MGLQTVFNQKNNFRFTICNDSLKEDNNCANSNLLDLNINDHLDYMGYNIAIETLTC